MGFGGGETPFLQYIFYSCEIYDLAAAVGTGTDLSVDRTGAEFSQTEFRAMRESWIEVVYFTDSQEVSFIQGIGGARVARVIITGG